jgi:hypothetical protein
MTNKQHVTFLNYQISFELFDLVIDSRILIGIKDINTNNLYVGTVKQEDITTQPLKKFYNILLKAFNLEKNYLITIKLDETNLNKLIIECKINFDNLFEINEIITLKNVDDIRNNDLQIMEQTIKEQENKIIELEKQIFKLKTKNTGIYIMTTQNITNSDLINPDIHNCGLIQIPILLPKQCKQIKIINCGTNGNLHFVLVQLFITGTCYFYDYCLNNPDYSIVKYLEIEFETVEINKLFF